MEHPTGRPRGTGAPKLALVLFAALCSGAAASHVRIGDRVPAARLRTLADAPASLPGRGQVAVLAFYSPFCAPCHRMLPVLVALVERVSGRHGVKIPIVVISLDGRPDEETVRRIGDEVTWLVDDGDADRLFDPQVRPCTYLVDAAGVVRHINRGFGSGYEGRVAGWLEAMLTGR